LFERFCSAADTSVAGTGVTDTDATGAKPFVVSRDARIDRVSVAETGCSFDFFAPGLDLEQIRTGLVGRYQIANGALALAVLSRLRGRFGRLTDSAICAGMLDARWPGRLEIFSRDPMIVLDGGHNVDGVKKLAASLAEIWGHKKMGIVYGAMKDKDYPSCLKILNGLGVAFYATCVPGMERSLSADNAAKAAGNMTWRNPVAGFENPLDAITAASKENDVTIVCGSLYLIGWVRSRLGAYLS
jgi:dihydrofolate synthase/folylpolyglutamate synthase